MRFAEWVNEDQSHGSESLDWLLLPKGLFTTNDGSYWKVGEFDLADVGQWATINFSQRFNKLPKVFVAIQDNESDVPVIVRLKNVTTSSFEAALFVEEILVASSSPTARVGFIAVVPAADSGVVSLGDRTVPYLFEWAWPDSGFTGEGSGYTLGAIEETSTEHAEPAITFAHPTARCIIGGDFMSGASWPSLYRDCYCIADFSEGWLKALRPSENHDAVVEMPFATGIRGVTDFKFDPNTERLYMVGRGSSYFFPENIGLDGIFYIEPINDN